MPNATNAEFDHLTSGPLAGCESQPQPFFIRAGRLDYHRAWQWQRRLHEQRVSDDIDDAVLLLEHDSVYTAGRRTEASERPHDGTPVVDVDRGGKITWHGPGQLTCYPIVKLAAPMTVVAYVRCLEDALIRVCAELGLTTTRVDGRAGVWVPRDDRGPDRKVAAIGVRARKDVTMHGFALNCDCNLRSFDRIIPCGIPGAGVTSLTEELRQRIGVRDVIPLVERHLGNILRQPRGRSPQRISAVGAIPSLTEAGSARHEPG